MRSLKTIMQLILSCIFLVRVAIARGENDDGVLGKGFDLDRMTPSPAGDWFTFVPEPQILSHSCDKTRSISDPHSNPTCTIPSSWVAWKAVPSFQNVRLLRGNPPEMSRVHLGASWSPFSVLQFSIDVPLSLYQTDLSKVSDDYGPPLGGRQVGLHPEFLDVADLRVGMRLAFSQNRFFRWGLQFSNFFQTGDHERLTGDRTIARFDGLVLGSINKVSNDCISYTVAAYAGAGWRADLVSSDSALKPGLKLGIAGSIDGIKEWKVVVPVAEFRVDQLLQAKPAAMDLSGGFRVRIIPEQTWWITALTTWGIASAIANPRYAFTLDITFIPWGNGKSR